MRKQKAAQLLQKALEVNDVAPYSIQALCALMEEGKPYSPATNATDPISEIIYNALFNAGAHDDGEHFQALEYAVEQLQRAIKSMNEDYNPEYEDD